MTSIIDKPSLLGAFRNFMPLVSREQSAAYRRAVVEASARLFRERGFHGVSVADLMAAAGLTHGGFYGHFASKQALAAEACALAFGQGIDRWQRRMAGKPQPAARRKAIVDGYLSVRGRDQAGDACPTAALANDVARESGDSPVRAAYVAGLESLLEMLTATQDTGDPALDRRRALADLTTLVGAMVLARATAGNAISDDFLAAARARLTAPLPRRKPAPRLRSSGPAPRKPAERSKAKA
jgi:TetR/AcrR family transcriptional repressor of nem operon